MQTLSVSSVLNVIVSPSIIALALTLPTLRVVIFYVMNLRKCLLCSNDVT
jgi:hypothetical protein